MRDLKIEVPNAFVYDEENSYDNMMFYSYNDDSDLCTLSISTSEYTYDDLKEAVKNGMYGETNYTYSEKMINGKNWSVGQTNSSKSGAHSYYAINYNSRRYSIGYDNFGSGEKCADALKIIEDSLNF